MLSLLVNRVAPRAFSHAANTNVLLRVLASPRRATTPARTFLTSVRVAYPTAAATKKSSSGATQKTHKEGAKRGRKPSNANTSEKTARAPKKAEPKLTPIQRARSAHIII